MKKVNSIRALRLIPIVAAALMMLHVLFLLGGLKEFYSEVLLVCGGFYLAVVFSKCLGFCALHRCMIYYSYAVMCCTWWERHGLGFGDLLMAARLMMFCIGAVLFALLLLKYNIESQ